MAILIGNMPYKVGLSSWEWSILTAKKRIAQWIWRGHCARKRIGLSVFIKRRKITANDAIKRDAGREGMERCGGIADGSGREG